MNKKSDKKILNISTEKRNKNENNKASNTDEQIDKTKTKNYLNKAFRYNRQIKYYEKLMKQYQSLILHETDTIFEFIMNIEWYVKKINDTKGLLSPTDVKKIDRISYIIRVFPSILLLIAKSYDFTLMDSRIKQAIDSRRLWSPVGPTDDDFGWKSEAKQCVHPKYRYLVNDSGRKLKYYLENKVKMKEQSTAYKANTRML